MTKPSLEELLKNRRVVEEINRHLWIESERIGHDIGFEEAAQDWYSRYADEWIKYHMPRKCQPQKTQKPSRKSK